MNEPAEPGGAASGPGLSASSSARFPATDGRDADSGPAARAGSDTHRLGGGFPLPGKVAVERLYLGLAADLRPDNIAVNCSSPSRIVLTEGRQAAGGGEIPAEMVEPPEMMGRSAALLAARDGTGITGTVQRSETLLAAV